MMRAVYWCDQVRDQIMMPESCTVLEEERQAQPTGLLDANGNRLYREPPPRLRMGFLP